MGESKGVRPGQAELSWGLTDENERDKDTKRGSSSVAKEHTSAARPFQTNSHPSVVFHFSSAFSSRRIFVSSQIWFTGCIFSAAPAGKVASSFGSYGLL